jgi:hypothetical protein
MEICLVGAVLIYVEGRTDMTELMGAFHNYVNVPKNVSMDNH